VEPMQNLRLQNIQNEILKYFRGEKFNPEFLDAEALDELAIYKSLTITAFEEYLENIFPCTYLLIQDKISEIIQDYLERHLSVSAVYYESARAFPEFIKSDFFQDKYDLPNFLCELALVEWAEIELRNSSDKRSQQLKLNYPITKIKLLMKECPEEIDELKTADVDKELEILDIRQLTKHVSQS